MPEKTNNIKRIALGKIPDTTTSGWIDAFGAHERTGFIKGAGYAKAEIIAMIISNFETVGDLGGGTTEAQLIINKIDSLWE